MKRCLTVVLAAGLLVAFVGVAQAEQGMPSQATLRAMGLSGMQVMNDREAMDVRGMGYYSSHSKAIAFGVSYASVGGGHGPSAGSVDGFYAEGKYHAGGEHGSHASKVEIIYEYGGGHKDGGHGQPRNQAYTNGGGHSGGGHKGPSHGGGPKKVQVKVTKVYAGGYAYSSAY